jgi:hypothetical protein
MNSTPNTDWQISGEEFGACNCDWGCPCQFNALPTHGRCEAFVGYRIEEGSYGSTNLDGVRFAWVLWWPGAMHEGDGTRQLVIDEKATPEQRDALITINSGDFGGAIFEIIAAVCPNRPEPIFAPIAIESDRETREAVLRIADVGEAKAEPIKNPVSGEAHRARIVLPDGFEYREAEMANAVSLRVAAGGPLEFQHSNTYAQLNAFNWSNA